MSRNATDASPSSLATLRATVLLPEPDPPATPMINGFIGMGSYAHRSWT